MADTSRRPRWRSGSFVLHVPGSRLGPVPPGAVALFGLLLRCFLSALLIGKLVALRVEQGGMVVGPVRAAARQVRPVNRAPQTGQVRLPASVGQRWPSAQEWVAAGAGCWGVMAVGFSQAGSG